jgi:hypothetical protein
MSGGGALDSSVTLDEVFTVLATRRVPLAPELAGYLVLEIAEHADPNGGDVDPKSVFVSEEGTVALVKPRREAREGAVGHAEASIRAMLVRLLEASGSQTAALAAAGKRKGAAGLPALAEELETALIPVNRAAGRRALARLAREVRRVTLGVGRNALPSTSDALPSSRRASYASYPSQPASVPTGPDGAPASARPSGQAFSREEDPTTARGQIPRELLQKATPGTSDEMPTMQFEPSSREPSPSQADVDSLISDFGVTGSGDQEHARDLKALAGLDPTPPPAAPARRARHPSPAESVPPAGSGDGGVESLLAMTPSDGAEPRAQQMSVTTKNERVRSIVPPAPDPPAREARKPRGDAQLPTQPSQLKRARGSLASAPQVSATRGGGLWLLVALAAVAAGGYAVWQLRPADGGGKAAGPADAPASPASAGATRAAPACKATLVVTDVPTRAEVLLHQGQAPVDVEKMPVGARLEFVATAEGFAPKRVVVPAGATWDTGSDGKPRFEAAVQLDKSLAKAGGNDPWPPAEPGTEVGGQGPPGTVHVVATPRGAEVWMLAGMGPETRVEQLRCDKDVDVLVAGPGTYRKRLRAAASDFAIDASGAVGPAGVAGAAVTAPAKAASRMARISAR